MSAQPDRKIAIHLTLSAAAIAAIDALATDDAPEGERPNRSATVAAVVFAERDRRAALPVKPTAARHRCVRGQR